MDQKKAEFLPRFMAAVIDGFVGWIFVLIPFLGGLLSAAYILLKDGIMFQITKNDDWKNKSIGKKVMNLEVEKLDGGVVDLAVSAKRNIPLSIGSIIAVVPILGWIIGPIVALVFAVIEIVVFLTDERGRRLGDRWANTMVVKEAIEVSQFDEEEDIEV
ncbi:MAG: RDD family protein [Halanaerobiales bacterium]